MSSTKLQHLWEWQAAIDRRDKTFVPHESLRHSSFIYRTVATVIPDEDIEMGLLLRQTGGRLPNDYLYEFTDIGNHEESYYHWVEMFPVNVELLGGVNEQ